MIHDNSIFCPVGHGRHSLAVAKSRSAECLLYDWRCQQSTLTSSVWKQTFHRFGIKRLHASTAKESSASSSEQTLNPGPCVAWSTCLYTEFLWNRHVTQSTLNDNWRDAHDKNTNSSLRSGFTAAIRARVTVWWNHWLGRNLVKQTYLHVVTEVATCDKLGPNRFITIKDKAAVFVDPVIDLYKTFTWKSTSFTYHHGEHYVTQWNLPSLLRFLFAERPSSRTVIFSQQIEIRLQGCLWSKCLIWSSVIGGIGYRRKIWIISDL